MTMFEVYSRIEALAKKRGVSLQKVATDIGLSENYIYNLKSKKTANTDPIEKIANYFNVSTDYLLGRTDNPKIASSIEKDEVIDFKDALNMTAAYNGKPLSQDAKDLLESMLKQMTKDWGRIMTAVLYFDGRDIEEDGLYNQAYDTILINAYLDDIDKKKVLYHEMGHVGQYLENYERLKEKFEAQANNNMIHHLLKEYLHTLDDVKDFNVYRFMKIYKLKTIANEAMVVNEFKKLI